jgi:O-antigen/teichoic acid export membrane protein
MPGEENLRESENRNGAWSLADQGAVSLGNFLTTVLLARALPREEYGIFVLIYGLLVLLNSFHSSAVAYPLSIQGATSDHKGLHKHARSALSFTAVLLLPFGAAVFGACNLLGRPWVTLPAIAALLCWQTQETMRRSLMAHLRHADALWGDSLSYLGQAAILFFFLKRGTVSLELVFSVIAATSLLAAILQAYQVRLEIKYDLDSFVYSGNSWELSRWAVLANTAVVLPSLTFPWIMALHGARETASYQALLNLVGITNPILLGISNIAVPAVMLANVRGGFHAASRVLLRYGAYGATLIFPCFVAMAIWPEAVLRVFYGAASPYLSEVLGLRLLVGGYAISFACFLFATFFYGVGQSKSVMKAQWTGAVVGVIAGFPLVLELGIRGAAIGLGFVYLAQATAFLVLMRRSAISPDSWRSSAPVPTVPLRAANELSSFKSEDGGGERFAHRSLAEPVVVITKGDSGE